MKPLLIVSVVVGVSVAAHAQATPRPATLEAPPGQSLPAFQARHESRVMAADTDGDGRVSKAEFMAAASGKADAARRFARLDRNGDGYLDKAEVDAMLARRFERLDADGNGTVSPQERAAAKAARSAMDKAHGDR